MRIIEVAITTSKVNADRLAEPVDWPVSAASCYAPTKVVLDALSA